MLRVLLIGAFIAVWQQSAAAQATKPSEDAATLYLRAAAIVHSSYRSNIGSPASSSLVYNEYPPYSTEWYRLEESAFSNNAQARALAHQARSIDQANWPSLNPPTPDLRYLNECRALTNDLTDAAMYQHLLGDDAAAIETFRDVWHLADMLDEGSNQQIFCLLVSVGVRACDVNRLMIITADVALSKNPHDTKALQVDVARQLIAQLLKHEAAQPRVDRSLRSYGAEANKLFTTAQVDRCIEQLRRVNAERDLAAMSIACHLYRFDTGAWPKTLDDLHAYIPDTPLDPWGAGKQTLGYALINGGLPDGADRPLVYSRARMKDGLFFRTDTPAYSFYVSDGSERPAREQKQGGQFRDVASWVPPVGKHPVGPTTEPLQ